MKISDLQRLADEARESETRFGLGNGPTVKLSADLARSFAGFDKRLIPSVADAFVGIEAVKLADTTAIANAARALESIAPIVSAPQISDALARVQMRNVASFAEAVAPIRAAQAFGFMRTLPEVTIPPSVIDAVHSFNLPTVLTDALGDLPSVSIASVAPYAEKAAEDSVALAEVEDFAQIIDDALGRMDKDDDTRRRVAATEVSAAISALLMLAGMLYGIGQFKAAGAAIGCVATLVRVYWWLSGKLD